MGRFAWRNLLTRPLRTVLALIGLSIPIVGVLGLFCISGGLRTLVSDTLSQIEGVMVLRENAFSPVFSDLPASLRARIEAVPGVRVVAPEVMKPAPGIEGRGMFSSAAALLDPTRSKEQRFQSLIDQPLIQGQDIAAHEKLHSAVFPSKLLPKEEGGGRFLNDGDRGQPRIVISRKIARDYPVETKNGETRPRAVGDTLTIGGKPFEIIGLYDTGSILLDVVIVMDIDTARGVLNVSKDTVSSYYVEATDPGSIDAVAARIETAIDEPRINAKSMAQFTASFGQIMGQLDMFLLMTVSLALLVGIVGIINTMLMSTTERFAEFGVLRTNGWSQANVLALVTLESAFLGLLSGVLGCLLAFGGIALANQFLGGGLQLRLTPGLMALGLALSVVTGTLGGLYPAWRAARLVPMEAIRLGAH